MGNFYKTFLIIGICFFVFCFFIYGVFLGYTNNNNIPYLKANYICYQNNLSTLITPLNETTNEIKCFNEKNNTIKYECIYK